MSIDITEYRHHWDHWFISRDGKQKWRKKFDFIRLNDRTSLFFAAFCWNFFNFGNLLLRSINSQLSCIIVIYDSLFKHLSIQKQQRAGIWWLYKVIMATTNCSKTKKKTQLFLSINYFSFIFLSDDHLLYWGCNLFR